MRRRWFLGGVAALAGCSSTPTVYYELAAVPGAVDGGVTRRIGVRALSIPGYLDQGGVPKIGGAYQFASYANDLWAEDLADMLQTVMVEDLAQRLPAATVIGTTGAIGAPSDARVEINVLRFDPDPSGTVVLSAQIAIEDGTTSAVRRISAFTARAAAAGAAPADIVAVMSALWGQAADRVAQMLAA